MLRSARISIILGLIIIVAVVTGVIVFKNHPTSITVGVLLPLTGPDSVDSQELLNWMNKRFNQSGGIDGTPVELVYKDTAGADVRDLAQELLNDPSIHIVIGPQKSSELHAIAQLFFDKKKLLISPMATAGDIFRAYGKKDFVWRTCQSDIAQVRAILDELAKRKVTSVSLIYPPDSYGSTFFQWTGFFCTELGIDLVNTVGCSKSADLNKVLDEALAGEPEYIISASSAQESVELVRLLHARPTKSKLFFTDATETNYMVKELGPDSIGVELMSPAADPGSGFESNYFNSFGYYPYDMAASTCDAYLLAVYTEARQKSQAGIASLLHHEPIEESFKKIINGAGTKIKWNEPERAVTLIMKGDLPDVEGASGPLEFDRDFGVDPIESFYSLNRVEQRAGVLDFFTIRRFSSSESRGIGRLDEKASAASTRASLKLLQPVPTGWKYLPTADRKNLRAVIISASSGWENYRHQADTLAVYQLLRENGVDDKDIILFSVDDVPWMPQNTPRGDMHNKIDGANLRKNAIIDYSGYSVSPENIRQVLLGRKTQATPIVLDSNENSNLLIYMVGHGMPRAVNFSDGEQINDADLAGIIDEMHAAKKYRQMLLIVEACNGESMSMQLETPGVLFLTGSSRIESSFAVNYDPKISQWLSDEFTTQAIKAMKEPNTNLEQLYVACYTHVAGSHVMMANSAQFGDLRTEVSQFTTP